MQRWSVVIVNRLPISRRNVEHAGISGIRYNLCMQRNRGIHQEKKIKPDQILEQLGEKVKIRLGGY